MDGRPIPCKAPRMLLACLAAAIVVGATAVGWAVRATHHTEGRARLDERKEQAEELGESTRLAARHPGISTTTGTPAPATGWTSEQVWSATNNDWEPSIASDPNSRWVYEATTRYGGPKACKNCPATAIIVRGSSDRGTTWGVDVYVCACKGVKSQNDPELAVAGNGTIYMAWLNDYNPGVVVAKSTDHGATWTTPVRVSPATTTFSDKPILLVSPAGNDVYVAWNASDSHMSTSHDGGLTFASVKSSNDALYWFAEGGAIAPNGTIFFAESAEDQDATGPVQLALLRSSDAGATWTTSALDTSQEQVPCTARKCIPDFFAAQATVAVDAAGKVMVLYTANAAPKSPQDLYVRTSADNGTIFGQRREVGRNDGNAGFPVIHAGPTAGDFRIAWQDDRKAGAWNTWYRQTKDGGDTWSPDVRLSDLAGGAPYKTASGYAFPYGDYFDLDVTPSGTNVLAWGEGPSYIGPGGTWFSRGG